MRHAALLKQSLNTLFARLMAAEEGRWIVITRTKGRNAKGQKWLLDELRKMANLMGIAVTYQVDPQFQICRGIIHPSFSQRHGYKPMPMAQMHPRMSVKSVMQQEEMKKFLKAINKNKVGLSDDQLDTLSKTLVSRTYFDPPIIIK